MSYTKPLPNIDTLSRPFWDLARSERLGVQVCRACGDAHFPGSPVCPSCLSSEQDWVAAAGTGTLLSWATFHRAYWSAFEPDLPYTVGLVRLDEGPLFVCTLVEFDESKLAIDLPVEVLFDHVTAEIALPQFRPRRS